MDRMTRQDQLDTELGHKKAEIIAALDQARPLVEERAAAELGKLVIGTSFWQKMRHPYEYLGAQLKYRHAARHIDAARTVVAASNGTVPKAAVIASEMPVVAEVVDGEHVATALPEVVGPDPSRQSDVR